MPGLLEGVRVLDLGSQVSAPFCARLLADFGADVIKVEAPGQGDPARRMGPFVGDAPHPENSISFLYLNTNKRGVTLDLHRATGAAVLRKLLAMVDVVVENFVPSEATSLGLDYPAIKSVNHRTVVTSITSFGQTGPYQDYAATDIVTTAFSGLMYHSGDSDREPLRNSLDQSLYVAGLNAAGATLAALLHRTATGAGQQVDVSVMECMATHLVQAVPYYSYMGVVKGRRAVAGSGLDELMPARDGYVVPSAQGSQPWEVVAELIGGEGLLQERFSSANGRVEHGEELKGLLAEGLAHWDRYPLFDAAGERRLVFGVAQDGGGLYRCPQLRAREFFVEVDHPVAGSAEYPGAPVRLSESGFELRSPAPLLGQHNREVIVDELGYSDRELVRLRGCGAV